MTAPSAISASKEPDAASCCSTTGNSSAPGTVQTKMSSTSTPSAMSSARQASRSALHTGSLNRAWTMPIRRPSPSRSDWNTSISMLFLLLGRAGFETDHFEIETRHARDLARRRQQAHQADPLILEDLRADAVSAKIHSPGPAHPRLAAGGGIGGGNGLEQYIGGLRAIEQHRHARTLQRNAAQRSAER